jgi:hypothetical protein
MCIREAHLVTHRERACLSNLPAELVLKILESLKVERDAISYDVPDRVLGTSNYLNASLDHITSTCLGLTCKALYKIHKTLHPQPLRLRGGDNFPPEFSLATRLRSWMPAGLVYNRITDKFVTPERDTEINMEENRKEVARWRSISRRQMMLVVSGP